MRALLILLALSPQNVRGSGDGAGSGDGSPWSRITGSCSISGSPYVVSQEEPPPTLLQKALNDLEPRGNWHYNDLPAGVAEAKRTGKPLCVVFR